MLDEARCCLHEHYLLLNNSVTSGASAPALGGFGANMSAFLILVVVCTSIFIAVELMVWCLAHAEDSRQLASKHNINPSEVPMPHEVKATVSSLRRHSSVRSTAFIGPSVTTIGHSVLTAGPQLPAECVICLANQAYRPVERLPCGQHNICAQCMVDFVQYHRHHPHIRCPLCREEIQYICLVFSLRAAPGDEVARVSDDESGVPRAHDGAESGCQALLSKSAMMDEDDCFLLCLYHKRFTVANKKKRLARHIPRLRSAMSTPHLSLLVGVRIIVFHFTTAFHVLPPVEFFSEDRPCSARAASPSATHWVASALHSMCVMTDTVSRYTDDMFIVVLGALVVAHYL